LVTEKRPIRKEGDLGTTKDRQVTNRGGRGRGGGRWIYSSKEQKKTKKDVGRKNLSIVGRTRAFCPIPGAKNVQ